MVKSYWDESGTHAGSPVCVMAGYFGGVNQWKIFENRWNDVLAREQIKEFHAYEFWARTPAGQRVGEYKEWNDERAERFLDHLIDAATSVKIHPVCCGLGTKNWSNYTDDERKYFTGAIYKKASQKQRSTGAPNKPIFVCFQFCVYNAAKYCKPHLRLHAAFDHHEQNSGYALTLWSQMAKYNWFPWTRLGDITFPRSEDAAGIQLADLFAYKAKEQAERKLVDPQAPNDALSDRLLANARDAHDFTFIPDPRVANLPSYLKSSFAAHA